MEITKIRSFFETHKQRGITAGDIELLAKELKDANGTVSKENKARLAKVAAEYYSEFSETGADAYRKLTGQKFEFKVTDIGRRHTALDVRAGARVPSQWHEVHQVEATMKKLIDEGESLTLTLKTGRSVSLEANDHVTQFVQKGYLKLYKNPKDEDASQADDNGRMLWSPAYYLVPTKSFEMVGDEIEKFSARGERITKAITTALDTLRNVTVSTRTEPRRDEKKDVHALKDETLAALPAVKEAFYAFEKAVEKFRSDTQLPSYPNGDVWLADTTRAAIDQYGPKAGRYARDVDLTREKNLIRANELLLARPEVLSVDDGNGGLTVTIDADRAFKSGKTFPEAKAEVQKILHDGLIADAVRVSREFDSQHLYEAQLAVLANALGSANVAIGQEGDHDFKDGVRGFQKVFEVKKELMEKAKALVPKLRELQAAYGFDEKHYDIAIWEKTR